MSATQSELTLANLVEERELIRGQHETKLAEIASREDKNATHSDKELLRGLRERAEDKDNEITELTAHIEREQTAMEESKKIRRILSGSATDGIDADGDGVVYRTMAAYARDVILTGSGRESGKIAAQVGNPTEIQRAAERLQMIKRIPANTLSSNVTGLTPAQHIAQIFQVIDKSRSLVSAASRTTLERGTLTYPKVTTRPVVAVQGTEKTEAGNTGMVVDMVSTTASTYLGGGDLSWQAINWSTPDALQLWFDLAAADYALKTEADAAQAMQHSAFTYNISTLLDGSDTYDDWIAALVAGASDVYANSGRLANALILAPDQFYAFAGAIPETVSSPFVTGQFSLGGQSGGFAGLNIIVSRGMDSGVAVVGDVSALLVAETAGAPVELRVVEPAIGGLEVGLIGAFEAVVVDPGAFAMITTAS